VKVTPIKTPPVYVHDNLFDVIKNNLKDIKEESVLVVTSKIVALSQGRIASPEKVERDDLIPQEADYYLPREFNKYGFCLSVKNSTLIASAGIDQSNANGDFVLWPENIQAAANEIREFLIEQFKLKKVGVIITDSHVLPLRWGTHGTSLAHSGFLALNNYIGKPDIFGRLLKVSQANIAEGLASAGVVVMGEGNEQTPLCLIEEVGFVQFQDRNPSQEELEFLKISIEDDIYAPLLTSVKWITGKKTE